MLKHSNLKTFYSIKLQRVFQIVLLKLQRVSLYRVAKQFPDTIF